MHTLLLATGLASVIKREAPFAPWSEIEFRRIYFCSEAGELGPRVEFKTAAAAEMARVYSEHDALLFTSAWEEPFALTPLEAMAARLPVIGTLEGGSRELIRHRENALAYRTGEAADLAAQVLALESEPGLRKKMVETAFREVREKYDIEQITGQIEQTLNQARQS